MSKGPIYNKIESGITTRDSLGIESATASIQGELCPVVTTVTPRAFYWIFMVWNYYDYYINFKEGKVTYSNDEFNDYLKKNDYFFVLANLFLPGSDQYNLVGKDNTRPDAKVNGPYPYNRNYFKARFGGMQYYNGGCMTLGFITDRNQDGSIVYKLPRLTEELGKPMALAFEKKKKNTAYYNNYRLNNIPVPKDVLQEFGKTVSLSLDGFNECKQRLREALFEPKHNKLFNNDKLIQSKNYIKTIREQLEIKPETWSEYRKVLFDTFSPRGDATPIEPNLKAIASDWEIVIGRQYFTIAIELIWKYLLETLTAEAMTEEDWIHCSIERSTWTINLNAPISHYLPQCNYTFETRESMIAKGARGSKKTEGNVQTGLLILLSLHNRFVNRTDINEEYLTYGNDVSISRLLELVQEYYDRPAIEFVSFIMKYWIIRKHEKTALEKLYYGRNGYFFEKIDGLYHYKHSMYPDYQGIRLQQLTQVMKDLDMLGA